ncbi:MULTISPECIES: hypothetical protein [Chromobacterium]|uniref:Uncharacterized protein n=1 Tax=Chromobacterium aquaticum TaxID=467180 RepID=A0ABV9A0E1_9NEIS|nr:MULTISPECIES: hypothetical protein [Chromobacterium]MCD5362382.1 hypothetical protein [Chromobacterium aquaticum]
MKSLENSRPQRIFSIKRTKRFALAGKLLFSQQKTLRRSAVFDAAQHGSTSDN